MKKIISFIIALIAMAAMSVNIYAATTTRTLTNDYLEESRSGPTTYLAQQTNYADAVYSVDIQWGDMKFTYTPSGTWNPETHQYEGGNSGKFTPVNKSDNPFESGDYVIIANHSNKEVDVEVKFANVRTEEEGYNVTAATTTAYVSPEGKTSTRPFDYLRKLHSGEEYTAETCDRIGYQLALSGTMPIPNDADEEGYTVVLQGTVTIS